MLTTLLKNGADIQALDRALTQPNTGHGRGSRMGTQSSSRKDVFGTEGIGDEGPADIGTGGHSSVAGTGSTTTGGTQGHELGAQEKKGKNPTGGHPGTSGTGPD
jgi:hypothetical protein